VVYSYSALDTNGGLKRCLVGSRVDDQFAVTLCSRYELCRKDTTL
jgi:hypothetical protein